MGKEQYLTRSEQYASVYYNGSSWSNSLLVMKALPNRLTISRFGFSVSRRVGGAVTRNRIRRLLREIMRQMPLQVGWDIIVIARTAAADADYAELRSAITSLLSRANLLGKHEEACLNAN